MFCFAHVMIVPRAPWTLENPSSHSVHCSYSPTSLEAPTRLPSTVTQATWLLFPPAPLVSPSDP